MFNNISGGQTKNLYFENLQKQKIRMPTNKSMSNKEASVSCLPVLLSKADCEHACKFHFQNVKTLIWGANIAILNFCMSCLWCEGNNNNYC